MAAAIAVATAYIATGFKTVGIVLMIFDAVIFLGLMIRAWLEQPLSGGFIGAIVHAIALGIYVGFASAAALILLAIGLDLLILGLVAAHFGLFWFAIGLAASVVFAYILISK